MSGAHNVAESSRRKSNTGGTSQKVHPYSSRDQVIDLTQQESGWAMMTSPSHTIVSIFEEEYPNTLRLDNLYDRVSELVRLNPWLTCRLRMTPGGIKAVYGSEFHDCFMALSKPKQIDHTASYRAIVEAALTYAVKSGESCIDKDEPLFRVTAVTSGSPLKQIFLVFSLSCVIADVPTMYNLYSMLDQSVRPFKMCIDRSDEYLSTVKSVIGAKQLSWLKSTGVYIGELWKSIRSSVHQTSVYKINNDWILKKKEEYSNGGESWVSTNDILTSWFMNMSKCDFGFINMDFRKLLNLQTLQENGLLAGCYVHHILLRKDNFHVPTAVRNSLPTMKDPKKCRAEIPNFSTTVKQNSCLVSNWAGITPVVNIPGSKLLLHIPILLKDKNKMFEQYSRWKSSGYYRNEMVIFKATHDSTGILVFGRGLKLNSYTKNNGPLKGPLCAQPSLTE